MELISIIVPVYKVEAYLDSCVESIVSQTYSNLEIILVDDGSPDRCGGMCEAWAKKDSRIRVLHKENGGLSDARNAGIEVATGSYIAFVDSDDRIAPDFVEVLYDAMVQSGAQIAACDYCNVFPDQEPEPDSGTGERYVCPAKEAIADLLHGRRFRGVAWNKLYHRSVLEAERYPVGKHHEDEFLTYRLYGKAEKLVYVDRPLYFYLQRQGSIMHSFTIKRLDALEAYLERMEYLRKNFPDLHREDKFYFCISCAYLYRHALKLRNPSAALIKKEIRNFRKKVSFSLRDYREASLKHRGYALGTGLCMSLFCALLNLRKLD